MFSIFQPGTWGQPRKEPRLNSQSSARMAVGRVGHRREPARDTGIQRIVSSAWRRLMRLAPKLNAARGEWHGAGGGTPAIRHMRTSSRSPSSRRTHPSRQEIERPGRRIAAAHPA
jgi:hypothetical protein